MVRRSLILIVGFIAGAGLSVRQASSAESAAAIADYNRLSADVARMQQELREQRQLIFQLMEMHSALLRYLQSGGAGAGLGNPPAMPLLPSGVARDKSGATAMEGHGMAPGEMGEASSTGKAAASAATISGSVHVKGGALGDAFVYVDGPRVAPAHPRTIEIKQDHKQFMPAFAVVQAGTRVLFPNEDKVFHNTFSRTPGDAFDLGTVKAGDKPNPVVFSNPGHVEVFCNIHSKMRADILVVPSSHWAKVRDDGTFQLTGVPVGSRHVVLWGPRLKQVSQRLELTAAGATTSFATEAAAPAPHLNKHGGEYGSYDE